MLGNTYSNLDVPKALYQQLEDVVRTGFEATPDASGKAVEEGVHFFFVMRSRPFNKHEYRNRLDTIEGRLAVAVTAEMTPSKVVIVECVDAASTTIAPDYALLDFTIGKVKARLDKDVETLAVALRYRQTVGDAFTAPELTEFAMMPPEKVFSEEEALEIFNRELDALGVELDLTKLPLEDDAVSTVIEEVVRTSAAEIGITAAAAQQIKPHLESVLT